MKVEAVKEDEVFFCEKQTFVNEKDEKRCSRLGAGPNYIIIFIR